MTHRGIVFAFVIPTLFAVLWAREFLSLKSPPKRIAIGIATLFLSLIVFATTTKLLPVPVSGDVGFSLQEAGVIASGSILGGGTVLSIMLVAEGLVQVFKRWNYYRRNGR